MKNKFLKIAAAVLGVILLASGIALTAMSLAARADAAGAIKEFEDDSYVREDGKYVNDFDMYLVIVPGEAEYDEGGAVDPIFGVSADSVLLSRISEMYQWLPSGSGGFEKGWSEELVDTGDAEHKNPAAYPASTGSGEFAAAAVHIGGFYVGDEQLSCLKARERIGSLPETDVHGFRTEGEYITNAEDLSSPEIGDVRIRYEYVTSREITITGMQLDGRAQDWTRDGHTFYHGFDGRLSKADVVAEYRRAAAPVVYPMLAAGIAAAICGAVVAVISLSALIGYSASVTLPLGKKRKFSAAGRRAEVIYGVLLGALSSALTASAMFAGSVAVWLVLSVALFATFAVVFGVNIIKHTPRRVREETPYVPILRRNEKQDGPDVRGKNRK